MMYNRFCSAELSLLRKMYNRSDGARGRIGRGRPILHDREVTMDISNQIKTRREAIGLAQEQLAEKLYVSRQTISNWERDKTYPDVQSLLMLAEYPVRHLHRHAREGRRDRYGRGCREGPQARGKAHGTARPAHGRTTCLGICPAAVARLYLAGKGLGHGPCSGDGVCSRRFALLVATVLERIKRENDLVTYREILAFMKGEADIERDPRALPRRAWPTEAPAGV